MNLSCLPSCHPPPRPLPPSSRLQHQPLRSSLVVQYWEDYSVSQLCLTLQETFGAAKTPDTPQPVRETLESLFSVMGIHVLPEGTQECPATLRLALSFTPLRAFYPGKGNCYTGVSMKGSMTISAPSKPSKSVEFNNRVNVSAHTRDCPNAEGAPFLGAWPTAVLDGLRRLWGAAALKAAFSVPLTRTALLPLLETISLKLYADELVPAYADLLADTDLDIARSAAIALEKFRSLAAPAVPQLTAALNTKDAQFFLWLGQALVSIGSAAAESGAGIVDRAGKRGRADPRHCRPNPGRPGREKVCSAGGFGRTHRRCFRQCQHISNRGVEKTDRQIL